MLADFYEQVRVLERDTFPLAGEPRKEAPQGRHAHGLLAKGCEIFQDFFPGLMQALVDQGGEHGDVTERMRWCLAGAIPRWKGRAARCCGS